MLILRVRFLNISASIRSGSYEAASNGHAWRRGVESS